MTNVRVIARLDIKGPNLVKGIRLEGLRVLGKPENFARYYYENEIDELIYMDVVASLYGRNSLQDIIQKTAREIFIPLTVGGGIRTIEDIRSVLRAGADKVSINTAAIVRPELIREASRKFGSSTIMISIEAKKKENGTYETYTDNGREATGMDVLRWAAQAVDFGAGELMVTSIDQEGTGKGYDLELIKKISEMVRVPVIACGGAGKPDDVLSVIKDANADAVAVASMFHYSYIQQNSEHQHDYSGEGNIEFLKSGSMFTKVQPISIHALKDYLVEHGIECRRTNSLFSESTG
jgi:cyclase